MNGRFAPPVPTGLRLSLGRKIFYQRARFWKKSVPRLFYNQMRMYVKTGYWPNLKQPVTLNEKIVHRNLFHTQPLHSLVSDKLAVREYVKDKVGDEILNEIYYVTDQPESIPFDDLPEKYVIKANHGCSWYVLVDENHPVDRELTLRKCHRWLQRKYGIESDEPMYFPIKPHILVEKYIEEKDQLVPQDIKFYCFNGKVRFIQFMTGRHKHLTQAFYDAEWNVLPVSMRVAQADPSPRPRLFEELVRISEELSADFDFARIDLYSPDDERIVFGEITLSPGAGGLGFEPIQWDWTFGEYWVKE